MGIKINQYALERLTFGDEDYYDIDYFDGANYQTAKIKGSTIKAGIQAGITGDNIYSIDGVLTANRTVDGGLFDLTFNNLGKIQIVSDQLGVDNVVFLINNNASNIGFNIEDSVTSQSNFMVKNGVVRINDDYDLPITDGIAGQIIKTDGSGNLNFVETQDLLSVNMGSTQWASTIPTPQALPDGSVANGFTFFDNTTDKVTSGTTSYDEYNIAFGIDLTLTGTGGAANIFVDGTPYLATFNTDLQTTVIDWIATHKVALKALGVNVLHNLGSPLNPNGAETIRFCASESSCNSVSITNSLGNLNGTRINPFTGLNLAAGDHVLVPYSGTAYEGQRIQHKFRVNFGIVTGGSQFYALSLRRFADDTVIGSEIPIQRNNDIVGVQESFISYTSGANDPFVLGGFYFGLRNDSGQTLEFTDNIGILCQHNYQKLTKF